MLAGVVEPSEIGCSLGLDGKNKLEVPCSICILIGSVPKVRYGFVLRDKGVLFSCSNMIELSASFWGECVLVRAFIQALMTKTGRCF